MKVLPRRYRLVGAALALAMSVALALTVITHVQHQQKTQADAHYASREEVRGLSQRMERLESALNRIAHAPPTVPQATFDAMRQTVDERMTHVEQLAGAAANGDALTALDQRVQHLEARVSSVMKAAEQPVPHKHRPSTQPKPLTPPFVILGEEQRGGQLFLSIAPPRLSRLDEVHLLQPGDSTGDWHLDALDADTAVFRIRGEVRRVPVH